MLRVTMFITAACFIFFIKLRWSTTDKSLFTWFFIVQNNESLYDNYGPRVVWIKDEAGTNIIAVSKITQPRLLLSLYVSKMKDK